MGAHRIPRSFIWTAVSIAGLTAATAAFIPLVQTVTLAATDTPPAHVTEYAMSVEPDGCTVAADLAVSNSTSRVLHGEVWWDLSTPGASPPWQYLTFRSTVKPFAIDSHGTARFSWHEAVQTTTGSYDATYWVHVVPPQGGDMVHADGGALGSLLIMAPQSNCATHAP